MKRALLIVGLLALVAVPAAAQTPTSPTSKLQWDQAATTLATANAFQYAVYIDGGLLRQILPTTCTGTGSPFVCTAALPAMTPGTHSLEITTAELSATGVLLAESTRSTPPFPIRLVVAPAPGTNLRIVTQ